MRISLLAVSAVLVAASLSSAGRAQTLAPAAAREQLREIYRELVEINTTDSVGSCTEAAEAMARRLAGVVPADDIQVIVPPAGRRRATWWRATAAPAKGGRCSCSPTSTWSRRSARTGSAIPFKLVEEDGYFYARGAVRRQGDGGDLRRQPGRATGTRATVRSAT